MDKQIDDHPFEPGTATVVRVVADLYKPGCFHAVENLGDVEVPAKDPLVLADEHVGHGDPVMVNQPIDPDDHDAGFHTVLVEQNG